MPFIKNPYDVLLEAAKGDLECNTEGYLTESEIKTKLKNVEEVKYNAVITAEMVSVFDIAGDYLVEMNSIAGYMKTNKIRTVEEALDNIAEANNVEPMSVGLLMESDSYVYAMLEKASKMKNKSSKNKALDKINKSTDLIDRLKGKGYKVKKKKSSPAKKKGPKDDIEEGCRK